LGEMCQKTFELAFSANTSALNKVRKRHVLKFSFEIYDKNARRGI